MAGSLTDAAELEFAKILTGQATTIFTTTPLTAVYLRLTTTVPTDSTAGTEVSKTGTNYNPVDTKGKWGSTLPVSNSAIIDFGTAGATAWGTVVGAELWTAASGGTRIGWIQLDTPKSPTNGDPVSFAVGTLTVNFD